MYTIAFENGYYHSLTIYLERQRINRAFQAVLTAKRIQEFPDHFCKVYKEFQIQQAEQRLAIAEYRQWCLLHNLEYGAPILYESL